MSKGDCSVGRQEFCEGYKIDPMNCENCHYNKKKKGKEKLPTQEVVRDREAWARKNAALSKLGDDLIKLIIEKKTGGVSFTAVEIIGLLEGIKIFFMELAQNLSKQQAWNNLQRELTGNSARGYG